MRRLLIYGARVGDLVLALPIMRHLARDGAVELVARPWARGLLAGQDVPQALHLLADPNCAGWQDWLHGRPRARLGGALAARGFDEIIAFQGEGGRMKAWLGGWAGATPVRWITFKSAGPRAHRCEAGREALRAAGLAVDGFDPLPRLAVPAERLAAARARLAPLGARVLAVQAGSSLTHRWFRKRPNLKGLTAAQWAGFISRRLQEGEIDAAVLHGSAPEGREARAIRALLPAALQPRVHDWTGTPLPDLVPLLAAHHAVASVDTGPAHIAAAVGTPLLVLFGPTDPAVFAPRGPGAVEVVLGESPCRPCHGSPAMDRCRANLCLTGLADAALDGAWRRLRARAG